MSLKLGLDDQASGATGMLLAVKLVHLGDLLGGGGSRNVANTVGSR